MSVTHFNFLLTISFSLITLLSVSQAEIKLVKSVKTNKKVICKTVVERLDGNYIFAFNGIPENEGWGNDLVYKVDSTTADTRTMGALGGIPLVDIWDEDGGIAVFNTTTYQEPFEVKLNCIDGSVSIEARGGSHIEVFKHRGDYYDAVREYALRMKDKGLSVKSAPDWAFNAIWETYGFEEDYDVDTIKDMVPRLKGLGIQTITIDSGWYGDDVGEDVEFLTGDFNINPDIIGSEKDWIELIDYLHDEGFRVRIWWVPGVAEEETELRHDHPEWFMEDVISSTGDTTDVYLDPLDNGVIKWNKTLVKRFLDYGVDGFKQDDIYHYVSDKSEEHKAYADLINSNLVIAQSIKKDFVINTCNCGLAQNFYHMPGQNQLITSDPVGSKQFRHRAKYLHALNVNGAAILGDHVELTRGDVGPDEMDEPGFYSTVDFSSIVPLGMVLQTKFREEPGPLYKKWFQIYNKYKFYNMEWINVPMRHNKLETYLLRDDNKLYFSFFTEKSNIPFNGEVGLTHLIIGNKYKINNILDDVTINTFTATKVTHKLQLGFTHSLTICVAPL